MSGPGAGLDVAVPGGRCQPCSCRVSQERRSAPGCAEPKCLRSCSASRRPPAWPRSLSQPRWGTSVPAAVTLGGIRSPLHPSPGAGLMLLLDSWTLARLGCPRRLGLAGDGAEALARTKAQTSGASLPAWAPQPCSAWGSAPPTITLSLALLALRGMGTHQNPLPASGPLLPLGMSPSPVRPWVGQTLCGDRPHCCSGGPLWRPCPILSLQGPAQLCGHCPRYPGTHGGNFS